MPPRSTFALRLDRYDFAHRLLEFDLLFLRKVFRYLTISIFCYFTPLLPYVYLMHIYIYVTCCWFRLFSVRKLFHCDVLPIRCCHRRHVKSEEFLRQSQSNTSIWPVIGETLNIGQRGSPNLHQMWHYHIHVTVVEFLQPAAVRVTLLDIFMDTRSHFHPWKTGKKDKTWFFS